MNRNNQQLEFLGDSVLEFVVSNHLYHLYPQSSKRDLLVFYLSFRNLKIPSTSYFLFLFSTIDLSLLTIKFLD